ncbi:copper resistance CopC family protein [Fulvimarina sp. MAC3]|uniref:copper resistance CopC family protein n=1 Tax=Fulvimarina sp. MAC3 TaxID=3148887 RepID=UPI0031FBD2DC
MKSIIAASMLCLLMSAPAALAHSKGETTPADGETVASIETISMDFDKPMRVTAFKLSKSGEMLATSSKQGMDMVSEYRAVPESALVPGDYTVEWRGLSQDGHPMQGEFSFTISE